MKSSYIIGGFNVILWAIILMSGNSVVSEIAARNIQGAPSSGQLQYYVGFPAVMVALGLFLVGLSAWRKLRTGPISFLFALAAVPYLFFYGGGV